MVKLWQVSIVLVVATIIFEYYYFLTGQVIETLALAIFGILLWTVIVFNPNRILQMSLLEPSNKELKE